MIRHALHLFPRSARRHGFTLLELCIVLFIMALLAGAAMPAMRSAFTEQSLRGDAHRLSLMVREGMISSGEEGRPYLLSVDGKKLILAPSSTEAAPGDPAQEQVLNNVVQLPDAQKKNAWETSSAQNWTFEPHGLCPLPRVRFAQGDAYVELSFNALTGDVEDEALYIP